MKISINGKSGRMSFKAQSSEDGKSLLDLVHILAGQEPPKPKEDEKQPSEKPVTPQ